MNKFFSDMNDGARFEAWLFERIKKKYKNTQRAEKHNPWWDICIPKLGWFIECKFDRKSKETGNIFVEAGRESGKQSGILETKATHYAIMCYQDGWKCALIETEELKTLCTFGTYTKGEGGSLGYVINTADLFRWNGTRIVHA
jgi:hypothetical protein